MAVRPSPPATGRDLAGVVLLVVAAAQILPGILALSAPGVFYDQIGAYPPENHHFIRDVGSWQIALGTAALVAWRRPSWRVPMLGILALQYALHTIPHAIDVGDTDPAWQGPAALALQVLGAVVLAAVFLRERGRARGGGTQA